MTESKDTFVDVLSWLKSAAVSGELRSEPRVKVRAPIKLRAPCGLLHAAETRDITRSGICIVSDWKSSLGEEFDCILPTGPRDAEGQTIVLRCRVCHISPEVGGRQITGARFIFDQSPRN